MIYKGKVFTGDYGFDLILFMNKDITDVTSLTLKILNPKGFTFEKVMPLDLIVEPKTLGKVSYTAQRMDFTIPGLYKLQLFDTSDGRRFGGEILQVRVARSIGYKGA